MILDLHLHSERSDDSRAPVETYLKLLQRKRDERPLDGIVLTEHRQFDPTRDFRELEDRYGFLILNAAEIETDYGHMLVYGVNEDILAPLRLHQRPPAGAGGDHGGLPHGRRRAAVPPRPADGRPVRALRHARPLDGVVAVEALNGGSKKGEDDRVRALMEQYGYAGFGGSDSHLVSFIGICATEFDRRRPERSTTWCEELRAGRCRAVDFRRRPTVAAE